MAMNDASIADLIKGAVRDAQDVVRAEIALAKAEAREEVTRLATGATMLVAAAIAAVVGVVLLLTAAAWAIAERLGWSAGSGFAIVALLTLAIAAVAGYVGRNRITAGRHMPHTVDTLKENMEWMRSRTS